MAEKQEFRNKIKTKVSVYILNYSRPQNLELSLPVLSKYDVVDEIVISHGNPDTFKYFKYLSRDGKNKIRNIKDYSNNDKYGAGRRFIIDLNTFKNDAIVILDDDLLPTEMLINRMLLSYQKDPDQIYGPFIRNCSPSGYVFTSTPEDYNTVITCLALTSKNVIKIFQDNFDSMSKLLEKYNGNGDDLTFNHIFRNKFNKNPKYIKGGYIPLDTLRGYSQKQGHGTKRNNICKELK